MPDEILQITKNLKDKLLIVASVIYLVGEVSKDDQSKIAKMLNLTKKQMNDILNDLSGQGLVENKNTCIFKARVDNIGLNITREIIGKIEIEKILALFSDQKQQKIIYRNLADINHPIVSDFLKKQAETILIYAKK